MTSPNATNCAQLIVITLNYIHGALEADYSPGGVTSTQMLRTQIHFSHTSFCLKISALTQTLNSVSRLYKNCLSIQTCDVDRDVLGLGENGITIMCFWILYQSVHCSCM